MSSQKSKVKFLLRKPEVNLYIVKHSLWESLKDCRNENMSLDDIFWSGGLRVFQVDQSQCYIRFEDEQKKILFGVCEIEKFPGVNFCNLSFSNRYFLAKIRVKAENMDATFIVQFPNNLDSMDLIRTLQTHLNPSTVPTSPGLLGKRVQSTLNMQQQTSTTQSPSISSTTKTGKEDDEIQIIQVIPAKSKPEEGSSLDEPAKKLLKIPKPFPCRELLCSCSFDTFSLLKSHWIETHELLHPCLCPKCKNPFSSLQELNNHRIKYHGFECPTLSCKLVFDEPKALEDHFFEMHPDSYKFSF